MVLVLGMFGIQVELESLVSQLGRLFIELVQEAIWKYKIDKDLCYVLYTPSRFHLLLTFEPVSEIIQFLHSWTCHRCHSATEGYCN